jgi:hypothetical protein
VNLDQWLGAPAVRTRYRREARTSVDELWAAAETVRLRDCRLLGRLVRARIPGLHGDLTFQELFDADPFQPLEAGPSYALTGLCGRIWALRGDFGELGSAQAFSSWDEPGTVRVLFAHWAEPADDGAALVSEVRVAPVDRGAALRLRAMEPFIAAFQGLVGAEALSAAARRASRDARAD